MNSRICSKWTVTSFVVLTILIVLSGFLVAPPVQADGGLAISGSFYRQPFEIPQGSSISAPSVYVVLFNNGDDDMQIRMTSTGPLGVTINISPIEFDLPSGAQRKVLIGVEVSQDAVPGEYEIDITAESYEEGVEGVQLMGAVGQSATLIVLGESAQVTAQALSPDGTPVTAEIRLFKVVEGQNYEYSYSDTGMLAATVSPGSFIVSAYVGGQKLAEESFEIASGEERAITLTVGTVYFEGYGVLPNYYTASGELAFANVVYTVRNLYQQVDSAEVILAITRDGLLLEELSVASLSPLDIGRVGLSYNYIPLGGWVDGSYGFSLRMNLDGEPYTSTQEVLLNVGEDSNNEGGEISIGLIIGIAALVLAIILVAAVVYIAVRRRRPRRSKKGAQ